MATTQIEMPTYRRGFVTPSPALIRAPSVDEELGPPRDVNLVTIRYLFLQVPEIGIGQAELSRVTGRQCEVTAVGEQRRAVYSTPIIE